MEDVFPEVKVEVEEMRRRHMRKAREKEARQEEGGGQDEHEGEEARMEEEEKSMWDRRADSVAIDRGNKILYLLEVQAHDRPCVCFLTCSISFFCLRVFWASSLATQYVVINYSINLYTHNLYQHAMSASLR